MKIIVGCTDDVYFETPADEIVSKVLCAFLNAPGSFTAVSVQLYNSEGQSAPGFMIDLSLDDEAEKETSFGLLRHLHKKLVEEMGLINISVINDDNEIAGYIGDDKIDLDSTGLVIESPAIFPVPKGIPYFTIDDEPEVNYIILSTEV